MAALAVHSVTSSLSSSISTGQRNVRPMTANPSDSANAKFVVDWNNPSTATNKTKTNDENLQDAFRRFREQRMNEIQLERRVTTKRKKKIRRSDPRRMYRLRMKFVEQAKKYLGVPYAKKYFQPGTPEYESKIFLDCCGLVRRVMYDLAKEFGFVIGPWNQSYMYDTLPTTVTNLSDAKPGDLVFISATYYNPKMKKQRHNLTHVEIMLGDGEKTIGARWNDGKVQYFDSYKFVSKSYHSQIYTIKSLDPWLKGICQSYCSEHCWRRRKPIKANKKSIFYSSDQVPKGHHHARLHSSKPTKETSTNSSNKKTHHHHHHHRRKHRHRSARSKSQRRTSPERPQGEVIESDLPSSALDMRSTSADEDEQQGENAEEEIEEDESIDMLNRQLTQMNCQEFCDDSDSLDEALDAELLDEENPLIASNPSQTNLQ